MKKALRIIAVTAGLVSAAATVILVYLYLEDASKHLQNARKKIADRISDKLTGKEQLEDLYDFE